MYIGTNIPIRSTKCTDLISQQALSRAHLKSLKKTLRVDHYIFITAPTLARIATQMTRTKLTEAICCQLVALAISFTTFSKN